MFQDSHHDIWIGTFDAGVIKYNFEDNRFYNLPYGNKPGTINDNHITAIYEDSHGDIWIGTFNNGLNLYRDKTKTAIHFFDKHSSNYLFQIHSIIEYSPNVLLITSEDGVVLYDVLSDDVLRLNPDPEDELRSLSVKVTYCSYVDHEGGLWIGTNYGGVNYSPPRNNVFEHYKRSFFKNSVSGGIISSFAEDANGNLWIGSYDDGLSFYNVSTNLFMPTQYNSFRRDMSSRSIRALLLDGDFLYVGTISKGLEIVNIKTGQLLHNSDHQESLCLCGKSVYALAKDAYANVWVGTSTGLSKYNIRTGAVQKIEELGEDNNIMSILSDPKGFLWVGSRTKGLHRYNFRTNEWKNFKYISSDSTSLPENNVSTLAIDQDNNIWIGTLNKGLCKFDEKNNSFIRYPKTKERYCKTYKIIPDNSVLWVSTNRGIMRFSPESNKVKFYGPIDGLQGENFILNSGIKTRSGKIYFGGVNGFNSFLPNMISDNQRVPNVLITNILISNQEVPIGIKGSPLKQAIGFEDKISLNNQQSIISFEFSSLSYIDPSKNIYAYMRSENAHKAKIDSLNREKDSEIQKSKIEFFTYIVHEIRTPLSLIIGPIEYLLGSNKNLGETEEDLRVVERNGKRLLNLVNQLLDFRKIETQGFTLNCEPTDVVKLVTGVFNRFNTQNNQDKKIEIKLNVPKDPIIVTTDPEALTKITSNLLSNAVKYTRTRVEVSVSASLDRKTFSIEIKDDGEGMNEEDRIMIFKPFFQRQPSVGKSHGSGLGLTLAKNLVELLGGALTCESAEGVGSTFTATMLLKETSMPYGYSHEEVEIEPQNTIVNNNEEEITAIEPDEDKPVVMIVDDNEDLLSFLGKIMEVKYNVVKYINGQEALEGLKDRSIDLIITDIMMPVIDGIEFCKIVKTTPATSHIPVIMLTAKTGTDSKLSSLENGADAYIEKPFSTEIIMAQVENLFTNRENLRKMFVSSPFSTFKNVTKNNADQEFIESLNKVIEKNIDDADFCIENLGSALNLSRSYLFVKIKAIAGLTPNEYIRLIRLKKAAELLTSGNYRINEVCFMVGFNSPSYFSKCFQKQFGVLPNGFVKNGKDNE